jgi:hypothetical protein
MANIFMMNKEIARGMVSFFHQKKHSYLIIICYFLEWFKYDYRRIAAFPYENKVKMAKLSNFML